MIFSNTRAFRFIVCVLPHNGKILFFFVIFCKTVENYGNEMLSYMSVKSNEMRVKVLNHVPTERLKLKTLSYISTVPTNKNKSDKSLFILYNYNYNIPVYLECYYPSNHPRTLRPYHLYQVLR